MIGLLPQLLLPMFVMAAEPMRGVPCQEMRVLRADIVYPEASRRRHEQGAVVVGITLGVKGELVEVRVLSSPSPRLAQAAVDSVNKWRVHVPPGCHPEGIELKQTFEFALD